MFIKLEGRGCRMKVERDLNEFIIYRHINCVTLHYNRAVPESFLEFFQTSIQSSKMLSYKFHSSELHIRKIMKCTQL